MNMQLLIALGLSYLVGALPIGWILVWLVKKKDIRYHASGRIGTSNVIRMLGVPAGLVTLVFDFAKGYLGVWIIRAIVSTPAEWMQALGGFLSVLGHVYSVYIVEKRRDGKYYFRGGAGGITSIGAAMGLWWPIIFFIGIPALLVYLTIGYASIATITLNVCSVIVFTTMVLFDIAPNSWWFVLYGVACLTLVLIALRPNLKRLRRGEERVMRFSLHAKLRKSKMD